jgi:Flp pilus assembly secretin CpaC
MVADGTTVIIGGLRKEEKAFSNEQIPYLGHLPVIGPFLFKKVDSDKQLTELVIFITPHISQGDKLITGDEMPQIRGFRDYAPALQGRELNTRKSNSGSSS